MPAALDELRRHHLAWTAPGRPEVHQHRDVVALDMLGKGGRGQFHRVSGEQRLVAFAAVGRLPRLCREYAVDRVAVRADEVQ